MKKILILITVLILGGTGYYFYTQNNASVELPEFSTKYNPDADAESDLNYAIAIAKEQNKRIILEVGGDWCPWCRAFDKFVAETSDVKSFLYDNFVVVKVYFGKGNYNTKFLSGFPRVVATPHFYVLESDGSLLNSQNSDILEKGRGYSSLKVMSFLQKWAKK